MAIVIVSASVAGRVQAHENAPAILNLRLGDDGAVTLTTRTSAEALLSGTADEDTSGEDPDDTQYNLLRELGADELAVRFAGFEQTYRAGLEMAVNGVPVVLDFGGIEVPEIGDTSAARDSVISYSGKLPAQVGTLTWTYAPEFGDSVLRLFIGDAAEPLLADYVGAGVEATVDLGAVAPKSGWQVFVDYIGVGFDHIIPKGLDHILFVIGLFLLSARLRPLLMQVTMFTLAHTITLALGALGYVSVPGYIVEPLIAASIVFVAVENIFTERLSPWRPVVIFAFGLLHGLGFASVLGEFGLPQGQFVPALIAFNIGVELGQLAVIAACFLAVGLWFRNREWYHRVVVVPASLAIAIMAGFWVLERTGVVA